MRKSVLLFNLVGTVVSMTPFSRSRLPWVLVVDSSGDSGPMFSCPKVGLILIEHDSDSCYFKMLNLYPRVMKSMIGVLAGTGEIDLAHVIQMRYTTIT